MSIFLRPAIVLLLVCLPHSAALAQTVAANLAQNPGFEQPAKTEAEITLAWGFYTTNEKAARRTAELRRSGFQSLALRTQGISNAYMCVIQEMPVSAQKKYTFQVYVRNSGPDPLAGSAHGSLGIEWLAADGHEIERSSSEMWDKDLSRMRWARFSVSAVAPIDATHAKFVIHSSDGEKDGSGTCYVDDVSIGEK